MGADAIRRANPGISAPLKSGVTVQIPDTVSSSSDSGGNPSITVRGLDIGTFDDFEIAMSSDAISKASFVVPNEKETRDIFVPLYYPMTTISANKKRLATGRCGSPGIDNSGDMKTLAIPFFGLPGILEHSGPPIDSFPLEYKDQSLQQIASDLCWKHGIETQFPDGAGARFKRLDFQPGQSTLGFLSDLAKQRSLVISDDENGALLFHVGASAGNPVGSYSKGSFPCIGVSVDFNDDQYYSSVTGYTSGRTSSDYKGKGYSIKNNYMTDVIRPYVERFEKVEPGELATAVNSIAGRMFSGVVSVTIELATWFDDSGDAFGPRKTIMIQSEEDYIPEPFEFEIATAVLAKKNDAMTATLNCVLPGVFSGEIPERMPWQR